MKILEKYYKGILYLVLLVITLTIFLVSVNLRTDAKGMFKVDGKTFELVSVTSDEIQYVDHEKKPLSVYNYDFSLTGYELSNLVIKYNNHLIEQTNENTGTDSRRKIFVDHKLVMDVSNIEGTIITDEVPKLSFEEQLIKGVYNTYHDTKDSNNTGLIITGILLLIVGLGELIFTKELWRFKNFLWVRRGEPTEIYIQFSRIAGLFLIVVALLLPLSI